MKRGRLLGALALTGIAILSAPAHADDPTPAPTAQPPEAPLSITVADLRPRAPRPGDALEVLGTVRNVGNTPVTSISLRLRVGARIGSRGGLHEADTDRPFTSTKVTLRLPDELAPGRAARFDLRTTVDALGLGQLGVYPLDLEARGNAGDGTQQLGLVPTWLPWFGTDPVKPTRVAVAWPLVDEPRQQVDGRFRDDSLATALSSRGRLGRLAAAGLAATTPDCGAPAHGPGDLVTPAPTRCEPVPVTFAVDPDLLGAATVMTTPYTLADGTKGTGGAAARGWLDLLAQPALQDVLALPFADPDVSALAGQPGAGFDKDLSRASLLGTTEVRGTLDREPVSSLAWPPTGPVTQDGLDNLARTGARAFVLDPSAYGEPDNDPYPTPVARTQLPPSSVGTALTGLVTDPYLSDLVAGALSGEVGPRLAEQRFLVETAMIAAENPNVQRTLVLAPDRRGDVVAGAAVQSLRDLGRVPWLCPVRLAAVAAGSEQCVGADAPTEAPPVGDRGSLSTSRPAGLSDSYLAPIGDDRAVADQLTDAVLSDAPAAQEDVARITGQLRRALARAESSAWRDDARTGEQQARLLHRHLTDLVGRVTLYGGQVLLTSATGRLQASLENRLDVPIRVRVQFDDGGPAIEPTSTGLLDVSPGNAVPAVVTVTSRKSGQYVVNAVVLDRRGTPFPAPGAQGTATRAAQVVVRSTGYGRTALAVTLGGASVLFLAAGVRLVRRARGVRRKGTTEAAW